MSAAVSLAKLVSALQFADPGAAVHVDTLTGEVIESPQPGSLDGAAPVGLTNRPQRYRTIAIDIDELEFARRFCASVADPNDRRRLETALSSGQSIEAFEQALYRGKIAHTWFPFRTLQLGELAKAWLEAQGLPFVDDLG